MFLDLTDQMDIAIVVDKKTKIDLVNDDNGFNTCLICIGVLSTPMLYIKE